MNKACNLMIGNMNLAKFWTSGYKRLLNPDQGSQHEIDIVKFFKINLTEKPQILLQLILVGLELPESGVINTSFDRSKPTA